MTAATYERTWTETGREAYDATLENGDDLSPAHVAAAVAALNWKPVTVETYVPAMPGLAIKNAIAELRIPKVTAYAISNELAPYGLYGIEGNYRNGRARVYLLDRGADALVIASDFWPAS